MMDAAHGYAYAVTTTAWSSRSLTKIAIGVGDAPPVQVSQSALPFGYGAFQFADLDLTAGYAYLVGTNPGSAFDDITPGIVVKVRLNAENAPPTYIGTLTVPPKFFSAGGIDPNTHYLYISNDLTFPASKVLQIALGVGDSLPTLVKTISLVPGTNYYTFATRPLPGDAVLAGEVYVRSGVMDPASGYIYFGTDTRPGQVIKVAIPAK